MYGTCSSVCQRERDREREKRRVFWLITILNGRAGGVILLVSLHLRIWLPIEIGFLVSQPGLFPRAKTTEHYRTSLDVFLTRVRSFWTTWL